MKSHLERISNTISPLRERIVGHPAYAAIQSHHDLRIFMQYHVYAVWDFMSLLKALQRNLTCVDVPWFPTGTADTRFLINEIVVGEESDVDHLGNRKSHFEIYLDAMRECGADTTEIDTFISVLKDSGDLEASFLKAGTPQAAQDFVNFTFETILSGKTHLQSATFTYGREDLIPSMFLAMVEDIDKFDQGKISIFKYYLERHIEVDGGHHGHLATEMTSHLCGDDNTKWMEAEEAIVQSLQKRIGLWDGVYQELANKKATANA